MPKPNLLTREQKLEEALRLALPWLPTPGMIRRAEPRQDINWIWAVAVDLKLIDAVPAADAPPRGAAP